MSNVFGRNSMIFALRAEFGSEFCLKVADFRLACGISLRKRGAAGKRVVCRRPSSPEGKAAPASVGLGCALRVEFVNKNRRTHRKKRKTREKNTTLDEIISRHRMPKHHSQDYTEMGKKVNTPSAAPALVLVPRDFNRGDRAGRGRLIRKQAPIS
jgi:hypothetical protein